MKILEKEENKVDQRISIINLFCKVNEYKRKYKIEKDESYRSKRFLAPTKYFIIFCMVYIDISITAYLIFRSNLTVNVLFIPVICYVGCYWFFIRYLFYKGRLIKIKINKLTQDISFQQIFPSYERLQNINVSDIDSIILWTDYLNPGRRILIFKLKNKEKLEFFDGSKDDCHKLGNIISQKFNLPLISKANVNTTFMVSNFIFFLMLLTSILFNDIIGQIFFLFGFIISYIINFVYLIKTYYKTKK